MWGEWSFHLEIESTSASEPAQVSHLCSGERQGAKTKNVSFVLKGRNTPGALKAHLMYIT